MVYAIVFSLTFVMLSMYMYVYLKISILWSVKLFQTSCTWIMPEPRYTARARLTTYTGTSARVSMATRTAAVKAADLRLTSSSRHDTGTVKLEILAEINFH